MARIRSIKPSFFKSDDVSALPLRARLTWIGLWTQCDDQGRTKDHARLIKADVWPLDDVSIRDIEDDLETLAAHGRIVRYEVDGQRYLEITNWRVHQAIQKPTPSRIPPPPNGVAPAAEVPRSGAAEPRDTGRADNSSNATGALQEDSGSPTSGKGKERKGREGKGRAGARDQPPPATPAPGPATFLPPKSPDTITNADRPPSGPSRAMRLGAEGDQLVEGLAPAGNTSADRPEPREASVPPSRCAQHIDDPTPPPCGPCADARRAHDTWQRDQARADQTRRSTEARHRAATARAAIDACQLCDQRGYLPNARQCGHDPERVTGRGAAAARAAIRRPPTAAPPHHDGHADPRATTPDTPEPEEQPHAHPPAAN